MPARIDGRLTAAEDEAMLAVEGTRIGEFTAESVYEEAFRACCPPESRPKLAQQMLLDGNVDMAKKARNRHKPARKSSFLAEHIRFARGDPVKLLERAIQERSKGIPPVCLDKHHARLYAEQLALVGALAIAHRKRKEMVEARR